MRMYPAYTVRMVLDERSVTFFAMLAEGKRVIAEEQYMAATIAMLPQMQEDSRHQILTQLQSRAVDPDLIDMDDYSALDDVKEILEAPRTISS